jgi:hypothetical protein
MCPNRPYHISIFVLLVLLSGLVQTQTARALTARNAPALADDDLDCLVEVPHPDGSSTYQSNCECEQILMSSMDPNPFFPEGPMVTLYFRGLCCEGLVTTGASNTRYCVDHCDCDILNTNPWHPTNWFPYWIHFMIEGNGP